MTEDNERRVSVRIDDERLSEWMDAQTNVSQSIRVLMMLARRFDSGDFTLAFAERGGFLTDEVDVSRPRTVKKGRQHASARVTGKQSVEEEKPEKRQNEPSEDVSAEIKKVEPEVEEPQVPEPEVVEAPDEQEEQAEQDRTADMMARLRKNSPTKRSEEAPVQSSDGDFSQMMVDQYNNN